MRPFSLAEEKRIILLYKYYYEEKFVRAMIVSNRGKILAEDKALLGNISRECINNVIRIK